MFLRLAMIGLLATLASPALAGNPVATPEPASMALLAAGIAGAAVVRAVRNRRK